MDKEQIERYARSCNYSSRKKSLTIIRFKKSCTLPYEKKGTEEELERKRVMVKFSIDGIVMKDDR